MSWPPTFGQGWGTAEWILFVGAVSLIAYWALGRRGLLDLFRWWREQRLGDQAGIAGRSLERLIGPKEQ